MNTSLIEPLSGYFTYNTAGVFRIAASVISFTVGLLVLFREPRSKTHQSFFLITLTGGLWMFFYAMIHLVTLEESAYLWLSLSYLFAVPYISPSVYFFSIAWTNRFHKQKKIFLFGYAAAFVLGILMFLFTDTLCSFQNLPWGRLNKYEGGLWNRIYVVCLLSHFVSFAFMAFLNIFQAWRTTVSPREKIQYRDFLIGFSIGYTGTIDFLVAAGFPLPHFGYIGFTLFILFMAYSILRHQFLDVNLLIKRFSLIVFIYVFLFSVLLPFVVPVLISLLNKPTGNPLPYILLISAGVGLVLSAGPVIYASLVRHSFWLRGHLSTGFTHELKSPLGAILGATEVMRANLTQMPKSESAMASYLDMIQQNATRLENFVQNLLQLAKIQEGAVVINKAPLDLSVLVTKELEFYHQGAKQKAVAIKPNLTGSLMINGDEEKLRQAVSNILSNAVKYSSNGEIHVSLFTQENNIYFQVVDQGNGVPKKDLERIFDRFYHGKHSAKGSGIGLTIAKAWVEAHGGKIWAESEGEGKGTKVTFTLPLA